MDESGPHAAVKGITEDVKGKVKEAVGEVTGNEERRREGLSQQEKASAERDVAAHEAQAEKARAEAAGADAEERAHQR
jgi:uncharacterized protein YjbJ (UPF0337 family)